MIKFIKRLFCRHEYPAATWPKNISVKGGEMLNTYVVCKKCRKIKSVKIKGSGVWG